ncbi:molybdopterin molybdotransferase MoeA [Lusitaniella coriacea LEGE 07157]|uniref:Molybdopterin molybdenumtransferase n=1 Tax=Lusitaniella coriacea LEGE 07157 TaxID=945747 RepID=A0A8J7JCK7_9CYAN|nr:gephyrin-like molybdotransferase Glp [Lusitaniella coriacea]MBE9117510.1 molybdopterin molybdotransferase MoeA [Lusitaniella coriacea LEGE 07157]
MLNAQEAEALILELVCPLHRERDGETVDLGVARDRILAATVASQLDFPHWDNSAMDGYAVRYADVQDCPVVLEIVEEIPAGVQPEKSLQSGQAARIFTGSVMPNGADTIVIQENTQRDRDRVTILQSPQFQEFVRQRASFYNAGNPLLSPGIAIGAPEMAILAAAQCTQLEVYRRPRVAILSTGDELVTPDSPLQPGQIVDSNQYALSTFVAQNGALPLPLGIVRDRAEQLKQTIAQAIISADIVLSTGGVSVGEYDLVDRILGELGGELHIRSVAVKPGKPLTVATFPHQKHPCLYFGIPGNPVSALVSCWRFVQPALKKLSGLSNYQPQWIIARSRDELRGAVKRETYLWGQLTFLEGKPEFALARGSKSSGNLIDLAQTTALARVPLGEKFIPTGEEVRVMLI